MRTVAILCLGVLALAGCSKGDPAARGDGTSADTAQVGPAVAITAAPGVAFNYRYAFRLPATRIAEVQERHAQACERLGVARCRITGMRYRLVNARDIDASLQFKLAPELARAFGRDGVGTVHAAEGMLIDAAISGEDKGAEIADAARDDAKLHADLAQAERPAARGAAGAVRADEAARLRDAIRANAAVRATARAALASTPVTFDYLSGDLAPGFDAPFRGALRTAGDNLVGGTAFMMVLVVTLLPWALLGLAIWLVVRRVRRRWFPAAE